MTPSRRLSDPVQKTKSGRGPPGATENIFSQMSEHLVQIPVIGTNVCESLRAIVGGRGINGGKAIHTQETKVSGALM